MGVKLVEDMYECARDAEVLVIATEWSEYANADLQKLAGVMRNRIIFDGRNILSPANLRAVGFEYHSGTLNAPEAFVMYSLILLAGQNSNSSPARK